ncbi:MAG: selenide, water dikinase SelD, partial [Acidobacteriota bacterium]|nr:selenide, water dikinase SelD [Acidobacteriota bacterium]
PAMGPMEDAGLLRPESGPPLVLTVDFITPIVDDPETFGAIAAANSLSDVYAMGGDPQVALAICGFPDDTVPLEIVSRVLAGGRNKAAEAGCAIVGGHTVLDPEIKYGLCVLGTVTAGRAMTHTEARPGDRLVLTKPLGSGIIAQAIKSDRLSERDAAPVMEVLSTLNRAAKDAAAAASVRAATDVTGFGLLGHMHNMLSASGLAGRVLTSRVPVFDAARRFALEGLVPGGTRRNLSHFEGHVRWHDRLEDVDRLLLADAQTSGGLLLSVSQENEERLVSELERLGAPARAVIGEVVEGEPGSIEVLP